MKRLAVALACAVCVGGVCHGQEPGQNYEHLKNYKAVIGTWEYDGLTLQQIGNVPKGTRIVARISWEWILNKNAVEYNAEYKVGDDTWSVKNLDGWDDELGQIVIKGFDSSGKPSKGVVTFSADGKELTPRPDSNGEAWMKYAVTGSDSLTVEFPIGGPKYTYKRVKKAK